MNRPMLVTMSGPSDSSGIDIQSLSNFEAGVAMLGVIHRLYPGITFGQLPEIAGRARAYGGDTMGRSWLARQVSTVSHAVGDLKDGIGDVVKSTFDTAAGAGGDVVRLLTDKKVVDGASSAYDTFASSGGVLGVYGGSSLSNFLGGGSDSNSAGSSLMEWITHLGSNAKNQASLGGMPMTVWPWAIAGGAVLFLVFGKKN